jgi:hypothetical protein
MTPGDLLLPGLDPQSNGLLSHGIVTRSDFPAAKGGCVQTSNTRRF